MGSLTADERRVLSDIDARRYPAVGGIRRYADENAHTIKALTDRELVSPCYVPDGKGHLKLVLLMLSGSLNLGASPKPASENS